MDDSKYKPHIGGDKEYISSVASKIKPKTEFEKIHFEYLTDLLQSLGIPKDPYQYMSLNGTNQSVIDHVVESAFEKIQSETLTSDILEKLYRLWEYLAEPDELKKSDLIFVFGGRGLKRVGEAVRLFNEGYASKILFTGKRANYMADMNLSEAEYYADEAKRLGVKGEDLILETRAVNTVENVVNSKEIFKQMGWYPKRIILISSATHMCRAYLTFKAVADWQPELMRDPVTPDNYSRENYFRDQKGFSYAFFEYLKLYGARNMRHF